MKIDLFQSCSHYWTFQIYWNIECSTLTASTSRILNSSTIMPSPSLALFIVVLPKAHLTSHSRISGSRWVITPLWLSGSWSSFVYSCHLFLISSAYVRSIPLLSFIEPIFAWNIPLVSLIFLKRSLVCPILLFSSLSILYLRRLSYLFLHVLMKWKSLSCVPLLCPGYSPGKNYGVGCHFFLHLHVLSLYKCFKSILQICCTVLHLHKN